MRTLYLVWTPQPNGQPLTSALLPYAAGRDYLVENSPDSQSSTKTIWFRQAISRGQVQLIALRLSQSNWSLDRYQ